jgi:hypothetical protein
MIPLTEPIIITLMTIFQDHLFDDDDDDAASISCSIDSQSLQTNEYDDYEYDDYNHYNI